MEEALPALGSLVVETQGSLDVLRHVSVFVSTLSSFSAVRSTHFTQLEKVIKQSQSDDGGKVKGIILKLIPNVKDIPTIDDDLPKWIPPSRHRPSALPGFPPYSFRQEPPGVSTHLRSYAMPLTNLLEIL